MGFGLPHAEQTSRDAPGMRLLFFEFDVQRVLNNQFNRLLITFLPFPTTLTLRGTKSPLETGT